MIDTRALHPLKILIESDRYLEPELITSAFTQLQALPSPVTANEKDTTEYVTVLSLLCRSLLLMDAPTISIPLSQSLREQLHTS